jgi:polyisoprenoid-binding protein YceI
MSAPQNVVTDLAAFAERGQTAATDVFQSWTSTIQAVGDAAGTQASSLRRLVRGMFDLADQAVAIERELATFLTVNAQVSAAALDTFRKVSDNATAALEDVARASSWGR